MIKLIIIIKNSQHSTNTSVAKFIQNAEKDKKGTVLVTECTAINQSINQSLFNNAISMSSKQKEEMWQSARTGIFQQSWPLKTERQTDVDKPNMIQY